MTGVVGVLTSHWGLTCCVNAFRVALIAWKNGCSPARCWWMPVICLFRGITFIACIEPFGLTYLVLSSSLFSCKCSILSKVRLTIQCSDFLQFVHHLVWTEVWTRFVVRRSLKRRVGGIHIGPIRLWTDLSSLYFTGRWGQALGVRIFRRQPILIEKRVLRVWKICVWLIFELLYELIPLLIR